MKNFFLITTILILAGLVFGQFDLVAAQTSDTDGVIVTLSVPSPPSSSTKGCKDPNANNYNAEADIADNTKCRYDVLGCLDPDAENYNSGANISDNSCFYVPMATNFSADYDEEDEVGLLSWRNPTGFANFDGVRILRKIGSIPASINDGVVVYDGSSEETIDNNVSLDTRYYYALFVRSTTGHYSAAVIASLTAEKEDDPFEDFPTASSSDPLIRALKLGDFIFTQPGEKAQYFGANGLVVVKGNKTVTVSLAYNKVPEVLKTIGITLHDPVDPNKTFSFTLRLNSTKTAYTATVAPLGRTGTYRVGIYILNFSDQTIKKITGNLVVATAGALPIGTIGVAGQLGKGLLVGAGVGAIILQTIAMGSASLADLYLLLLRLIGAISGFFGGKKKSPPWGTVYDAVTKRPIDPAYVSVVPVNKDEEASSAITDIDGRYGFFLPAGQYLIKVGKTHYLFPSKTLAGKDRDELYRNLYFGEPVQVAGEEVVNKNIPLDPIGFDWNEFAKSKSEFFKIYSTKEIRRNRLLSGLYVLGFVMSLASLVYTPSWFDVAIVTVYIALYIFQQFWSARHRPVQIKSEATGEPLPFAIVRFYFADLGTEVRSVVADELGRFFALLRPGKYFYTVEEKQNDGSYKRVLTSAPVEMKRGLVAKNILV